jgi:copper transport protein
MAAGAWLGGLTFLLWAAYPSSRGLPEQQRIQVLGPVARNFSNLAVVAVAVVVVSGVFRSWIEVRALRALTGATYGWVLLAKLGAFLPVLALGAINNRWTLPRIDRAAKERDPGKAPLQALRRLVAAEVGIATIVIALTAFLVNLPPARLEAGVVGPFITDVRLGQNNLNLLVDPNQVGENEVHLTLTAPSGAPVPVRQMRVLFRMPSEGIGPLVGSGVRLAPGHFVVQGHQLSVPGEWTLEVVARSSRFEEERTRVAVPVNP